jgi:histidine triad (HIT) family protein
MAEDCIFCKIRDGEIPSDILYRDELCFVIRDIAPAAPTHLLVIPTEHFEQLSELESRFDQTFGAMFAAARDAASAEGVSDSGYRLTINQGKDGGQEVPHLHMHVMGGRRLGGLGIPGDRSSRHD